MVADNHIEINTACHDADNVNIRVDDYLITVDAWNESPHNGDPYDEHTFEIEIPKWLHCAIRDTTARHMSRELDHINSGMKQTFEALMILNSHFDFIVSNEEAERIFDCITEEINKYQDEISNTKYEYGKDITDFAIETIKEMEQQIRFLEELKMKMVNYGV
jgi:hypothetical protein